MLPGKTATAYSPGHVDGRWAIHAKSERSASMYRRSVRIEPGQLGNVTFSWKAASLLPDADVRESETGDAVVRVMLAFDGDSSRLSARTRMMFDLMQSLSGEPPPFATLMYVWDSRAEIDTGRTQPAQLTASERSFSSRGRRIWGSGAATSVTCAPTIAVPSARTLAPSSAWRS